MDVSVGHVLKGLPYLHLTLWLLRDVCYADMGSLPQSVRQWQVTTQASTSKIYQQCWKEWAGRVVCLRDVPNNAISVM